MVIDIRGFLRAIPGLPARIVACSLLLLAGLPAPAEETPCSQLAPAGVSWKTKPGPSACYVRELKAEHNGRSLTRLDVGVSGEAEGAIVAGGARAAYFTTAPDFVFVQTGYDEWQNATVRYEAQKGMGLTLLIPSGRERWNGKLFVTAHGAGRSHAAGNLRAWDERAGKDFPLAGLTRYELLMLEKGYAVAVTHRSSDKKRGDCTVRLEDGSLRDQFNITETPHLMLDFARIAQGLVEKRLGAAPARTYFYGHSAGGRNGRLINFVAGLNRVNGKPAIDGFLIDDAGSGLWLPVRMKDDQDVLLGSALERDQFAPQMDISHLLYVAFKDEPSPEWVSPSYLINKRRNAQILASKRLGIRHRYYEVRGVSHSGGESMRGDADSDVRTIPLWRIFDSLIDRLDAWVDSGVAAPPSRTEDPLLARQLRVDSPHPRSLALPEIACPLGVYFQYPSSLGTKGIGQTGFALFDSQLEEPLDGRGVFVDMNGNGYHDQRESVDAAWRRLGLLAAGEAFGRDAYLACVEHAARSLHLEGFLSEHSVQQYIEAARVEKLPPPPGAIREVESVSGGPRP